MMKPLLSSILIVTITLPNIGTNLFLRALGGIVKHQVKEQLQSGLTDEQLISFTFSDEDKADLEWEDAHEFKYNGKMYDVVRVDTLTEGTIQYAVYEDNKESEVKKLIETIYSDALSHHPSKTKMVNALSSFMQGLIFVPLLNNYGSLITSSNSNFEYVLELNRLPHQFYFIPPEGLLS